MLRSVELKFLTDVSGQPIDPNFKDKELLATEGCVILQKNAGRIYIAVGTRYYE